MLYCNTATRSLCLQPDWHVQWPVVPVMSFLSSENFAICWGCRTVTQYLVKQETCAYSGPDCTRKRPPNRPIVVVFSFKTAGCLADQAKLFKSDSLLLLLSCFSNHTSPPLTKGQLSYLPSFIYSISRRGVGCQNQPIFRSNASSFKKIIIPHVVYPPTVMVC